MKKACISVGEAVWTMTYVVDKNNEVLIHDFNCEDPEGYTSRSQLSELDYIEEGDNRVAVAIGVAGERYVVKNQQNVFTYKAPL